MHIAILGAGVAGAAAAITLVEHGHTVHVYERRPLASTLGAGVTLWPNATFVLEQLGLLDRLRDIAGQPTSMQRLTAAGAPLGAIDIGAIDEQMGHPTFSVLRRDLQRVLLDRLDELGVRVVYGGAAREVGCRGGLAWAGLENGEAIEAELIVGAEGRMASVARRFVEPASAPIYQGFVNWVGIAESPERLVADPQAILDYWGTGMRFGIVPLTASRAYWAAGSAMPLDTIPSGADLHEELLSMFAAWPSVVQRIIQSSARDSLRTIPVHDLEPLPRWHSGRVVLIGDAAHASLPTSGQGACQALEDAWHLGRRIPLDGRDLAEALDGFSRDRQPKTRRITFVGRQLARTIFECDPERCRDRDAAARASDHRAAAAGMAAQWSAGLPLSGNPSLVSRG